MKSRTNKPNQPHQKALGAAKPAATPLFGRYFGHLLLIGASLAVAGGTWAVLELVVWNRLPPALVGKWEVVGGEQDGATFDFYRNGTMRGRLNVRGREGIVDAQVTIEGDTLLSTTRNPNTGQAETRRQRIKSLTTAEFVLEDDRGQVLRMTRAE